MAKIIPLSKGLLSAVPSPLSHQMHSDQDLIKTSLGNVDKAAETAARRMVEDHFKQENARSDPMEEFTLINANEYPSNQEQEDRTPVCKCFPQKGDPDSTCGRKCLNVINSVECTPALCPCKAQCKNQRFQRSQCAKTKLIKTKRKGWGLAIDEDFKAGDLVIEFCGDVISNREAHNRAKGYKSSGLKHSYIIRLSSTQSIDATRKGSLGRFINHSCEPNCERRKWTVQGKDRLGIFAIVDISAGTELTYDYHMSEWHDGGLKVSCGCETKSCVGILGGNSKRIQKDAYEWVDDTKRNEELEPLISSDEDDAPLSSFIKGFVPKKLKGVSRTKGSGLVAKNALLVKTAPSPAPVIAKETTVVKDSPAPVIAKETSLFKDSPKTVAVERSVPKTIETQPPNKRNRAIPARKYDSTPKIATLVGKLRETIPDSRLKNGIALPPKPNSLEEEEIKVARKRARSDAEARSAVCIASTEQIRSGNVSRVAGFQRARNAINKQLAEELSNCLPVSEAACAEVEFASEMEMVAASDFRKVCDEIQPTVKEFQNLGQEVSPAIAQKWLDARCKKLRSTIDFHFSIIRHLAGPTFALSEARDSML